MDFNLNRCQKSPVIVKGKVWRCNSCRILPQFKSFQAVGSKWSASPDLEERSLLCWKTTPGHCESESVLY